MPLIGCYDALQTPNREGLRHFGARKLRSSALLFVPNVTDCPPWFTYSLTWLRPGYYEGLAPPLLMYKRNERMYKRSNVQTNGCIQTIEWTNDRMHVQKIGCTNDRMYKRTDVYKRSNEQTIGCTKDRMYKRLMYKRTNEQTIGCTNDRMYKRIMYKRTDVQTIGCTNDRMYKRSDV